MSQASQSLNQPAPNDKSTTGSRERRRARLPGQDLSIEETLRVMDVAREMRDQRQNAEEMFRRDDLRVKLRDKLLRTARLSGDDVSEAEIDTAIAQYFESLHTFQEPVGGFQRVIAHGWIWRGRILAATAAAVALIGSYWFLFS